MTPFKRSLFTGSLLACVGAVSGCGSLDPQTGSAPALATIKGELVNPSAVPVSGDVRVAVVWQAAPGEGKFNVAQDAPVKPVFPSSFLIQLDAPPPASAMITEPAGVGGPTRIAYGAVVAYLDKNGNGKLDLVPADSDAGGYVDQILATNPDEVLMYAEGTLTPIPADSGVSGQFAAGYNLGLICNPPYVSPGSICPTPPQASCTHDQILSIETPITLSVSSNPLVNSLMCSVSPGAAGAGMAVEPGRPAAYPSPCDPNLQCASDGSSYFDGVCTETEVGLCGGALQTCTGDSYQRPDPVPSDWPCRH